MVAEATVEWKTSFRCLNEKEYSSLPFQHHIEEEEEISQKRDKICQCTQRLES